MTVKSPSSGFIDAAGWSVRRWLIPLLWLLAALGCGWIVLTTPVSPI
jgi:hypothetical protein